MHAKYEVSISNGSRVIAKVKVDNRQTDRHDKNNIPPIIRSGGMKIHSIHTWEFQISHVCHIVDCGARQTCSLTFNCIQYTSIYTLYHTLWTGCPTQGDAGFVLLIHMPGDARRHHPIGFFRLTIQQHNGDVVVDFAW